MMKHVQETCEEIRRFGGTIVAVEQNRHVKIRYSWQGRADVLIVGTSPSDRNAIHHQRALLRRKLGRVQP
jgi:hypothetical protein